MSKQRAELKGLFCHDCGRPALDECPKCGKLVCDECSADNLDCHDPSGIMRPVARLADQL